MGPRARVACIDEKPEDRNRLRSRLESMYSRHRQGLRFGLNLELYLSSREEVFLSPAPEVFVIGPSFGVEAAHSFCVELRNAYPHIPILVFLTENAYSLRILRRFESVCDEVFAEDEGELRIVHAFLRYCSTATKARSAAIFNFIGSKGGIGTTSVVTAIADVLIQQGKRVVVLDLSKSGVIPFYLACERWESRVFSVAIRQRSRYSDELFEDCVVRSPSGVSVVLPPAGGGEVRDIWLHDSERLDLSISLLNSLTEQFDFVLVDSAHTEGLLPFALACRATTNILVTSNEAASVHLAGQMLADISALPGEGSNALLFNLATKDGLLPTDMIEFLERYAGYSSHALISTAIPHDSQARYWIGSGESFYSVAGSKSKVALEQISGQLTGAKTDPVQQNFVQRLLRPKNKRQKVEPLFLPAPESAPPQRDTLTEQSLYSPPEPIDGEKSETLRCGAWKQQ